jgi:hypothetical protein
MRRLEVGLAVAILFGSAACSTSRKASGTCGTTIDLNVDKNGDLNIPDPDKLVCAADAPIGITFVNHDTKSHVFEISEIGCKGDKKNGKNPSKDMLGHPTQVGAGASAPLAGSPKMLTQAEIKAVTCNGAYVYSYSIRVNGLKGDKDPDLEVSPPPPLQ